MDKNLFKALFYVVLHKKMDKLERKLQKYGKIYFDKDVAIMYIPKDNLKVGETKWQIMNFYNH